MRAVAVAGLGNRVGPNELGRERLVDRVDSVRQRRVRWRGARRRQSARRRGRRGAAGGRAGGAVRRRARGGAAQLDAAAGRALLAAPAADGRGDAGGRWGRAAVPRRPESVVAAAARAQAGALVLARSGPVRALVSRDHYGTPRSLQFTLQ